MALPIIAIVGQTAAGKTAISIELAHALGDDSSAEIISADAMQLYRGMDVGTAKASLEERRGIVHHQLDVLDVGDEASVAAYQRHARVDLEGVLEAGKTPIVVGGSGLYVSGLLDKLEFPGHSPQIREELEAVAQESGLAPLVSELAQKDPRAHATIDLKNPRRVIRALEVIRLTGRPYTPVFPRHTSHYEGVRIFGVRRERDALAVTIESRARAMFADGLVEETRELLREGLADSPTARRATGYAEAIAVIEGQMSVEEAIASVAQATLKLAKKQRTWFGADPRVRWIDMTNPDVPAAVHEIVATVEG